MSHSEITFSFLSQIIVGRLGKALSKSPKWWHTWKPQAKNYCNLGALLCLAEEDVECIVCEQIVTTEYTEFVAYISPPCETIHQVLTKFCACRT